ncbi:protein lin-54 homolog isoform X2 [Zophobas morio]|uniref:protein lin-54 homolog isoform X2 n=1 Tax=Zophobas morio TaxID=2755281 RepID=UPI003082E6E2
MSAPAFTLIGGSDDVEALVDTLTIEGATLNESNLSGLTSTDIQQLAELSQELHLSNEMETDEVIIETVDETGQVEEEVMQSELAHEVEIETERAPSPEEILPDVKTKTTTIPPLRPLTIAPKPTKVPIAMKPMPGQQLLLLQGTNSNQAIKLVSSQGQELNLANISLGRPVAIKPAVKTVTTQGNLALMQPKQVVMKKIITSAQKTTPKPTTTFTNKQGHIMVVQKADQVKLLPSQTTLPSPTKTITLQQAQEMGLITTTKMLPQAQSTPKHTVVLNKASAAPKTIKIVPQVAPAQFVGQKTVAVSQIKSPTKILPATQTTSTSKVPQRIFFKSAATGTTILPSAQIIQVAGTQALSTGQLHQINIPGKGMQYIKFVTATNSETLPTSASTITTVKTPVQASPTNIVLSEIKPAAASQGTAIAPKPLKNIAAKTAVTTGQVVMLPSYVQTQLNTKVPIPMRHTPVAKQVSPDTSVNITPEANLESNGMRPRKPCNCTKSQCLKLYCDCFANGEFCYMCNCMNCYNNLDNEDHRQRAIKTCLERNPNAFRPKIGKAKDVSGDSSVRKHTKGCNCKRSGCLKNYCECYEAKIACSNNCKCVGCRNIEDSMEKKGMRNNLEDGFNQQLQGKMTQSKDPLQFRPRRTSNSRQAINFINDDVIEATSQCMLTISNSEEAGMQDDEVTKRQIIEEFGRCLKEIIDYSMLHN